MKTRSIIALYLLLSPLGGLPLLAEPQGGEKSDPPLGYFNGIIDIVKGKQDDLTLAFVGPAAKRLYIYRYDAYEAQWDPTPYSLEPFRGKRRIASIDLYQSSTSLTPWLVVGSPNCIELYKGEVDDIKSWALQNNSVVAPGCQAKQFDNLYTVAYDGSSVYWAGWGKCPESEFYCGLWYQNMSQKGKISITKRPNSAWILSQIFTPGGEWVSGSGWTGPGGVLLPEFGGLLQGFAVHNSDRDCQSKCVCDRWWTEPVDSEKAWGYHPWAGAILLRHDAFVMLGLSGLEVYQYGSHPKCKETKTTLTYSAGSKQGHAALTGLAVANATAFLSFRELSRPAKKDAKKSQNRILVYDKILSAKPSGLVLTVDFPGTIAAATDDRFVLFACRTPLTKGPETLVRAFCALDTNCSANGKGGKEDCKIRAVSYSKDSGKWRKEATFTVKKAKNISP